MGQDTTMNVHVTGLDLRSEENYKSQVEVLNKIFPEKDEKNSTSDYIVKYSKNPNGKPLFIQIKTQQISLLSTKIFRLK